MLFHTRNGATILTGLICHCAFFCVPAQANTTQANAQSEAEALHRKAADLSMQNSTSSAMTALMDLASLNVTGAVSNGYKAYGSYRNSEELDLNADFNLYLKNKMQSSNSAFTGAIQEGTTSATKKISGTGITITDTTFSRLNPSFLQSGEAAKVAAEFESKTGMSRKVFLSQLAKASENKISVNDPQLMDKIVSRFEGFVAQIPNAEFRKNLEKGIAMIPQTARSGLVAKAIQKAAMFASGEENKKAEIKPLADNTNQMNKIPMPASSINAELSNNSAPTKEERKPSSEVASLASTPISDPEKESNDPFAKIIQAAADAKNNEESIFSQVTRKYRQFTPQLISKNP